MSADIAYRLIVDLSTRGSLAPELQKVGAQAKSIDSGFKNLGASLGSVMSSVGGVIEGIGDRVVGIGVGLAKMAAVGAGAGIAYGVGKLNSELEKTQISLAAIFNAQGMSSNMSDGMDMASKVMEKMRVHARDLPGELKDLQNFFKLGATPGFQLGASVGQLENMSAQGMAAAAATGVNMDQAAREFAQLLQGHAGGHNVFGSMLGFSGEAAKKLNAATGSDRLKMIEEKLGKFQGSIETFGGSFEALSSTMVDNAKLVIGKATAPLFAKVKEQMSATNKYFEEHQAQIIDFATRVGDKLADAFDAVRRKIYEWGPALKSFAENAAAEFARLWQMAKPLLEGIEKVAKGAVGSKGLFKGLEAGALAYGGVKAAKFAAPAISGIGSLMGGGEAAAGLAGLGASAGILGAAALAALVPLGAAAGALHAITDESSAFHDEATRTATAIAQNTTKTFENTSKIWEKIGPQATAAMDAIGVVWMTGFEVMSIAVEKATFGLSRMTVALSNIAEKFGLIESSAPGPGSLDKLLGRKEFERTTHERNDDERKTKAGAGGGGGGTHIQKVEIVVSSNQDPSRIARLTADIITDRSRFNTSSPTTRNFSASRPR